ncbi:hypothetical protein ACRRTK_020658 [Alexandromys fortis]
MKEEGCSRGTSCAPPFGYHTTETMSSGISCWQKGKTEEAWCQPEEELVSWKKISYRSDK